MTDLKLHHIGEPLIAAMLQRIETAGRLSNLICPWTHVSVEDTISSGNLKNPLAFLPERAVLSVSSGSREYMCDGAQKIDVLCVSDERAIAFELKLGEERLRANEFESRFMENCATSHAESRLKGKMVSILERRFPWSDETTLYASAGTVTWEVLYPWWLIIRRTVWSRWKKSSPPNLRNGHILVLEEIVREFGGEDGFNSLVRELVGGNFYGEWRLGQ